MERYLQHPIRCPYVPHVFEFYTGRILLILEDKYEFHGTSAGGLNTRRHLGKGVEWRFCDSRKKVISRFWAVVRSWI